MELNDLMQVAMRWAHAIAGVAWVGGALFYLLVLQPSLASVEDPSSLEGLKKAVGREFKEVVDLSIMALVISGAILTFDRLSRGGISNLYVGVLVAKVAMAGGMIFLSRTLGQKASSSRKGADARASDTTLSPMKTWLSPARLILVLGVVVFLLAAALRVIYETNLRTA